MVREYGDVSRALAERRGAIDLTAKHVAVGLGILQRVQMKGVMEGAEEEEEVAEREGEGGR